MELTIHINPEELENIVRQSLIESLECKFTEEADRKVLLGALLFYSSPSEWEQLEMKYD